MLAGRRALHGLMAGGRNTRNAATAFATAAAALDKETAQNDDTYGSTSQGFADRRDEGQEPGQALAVTPAEAFFGTQRHIGQVMIPEDIDAALEQAVKDGSMKNLRQQNVVVTEKLRKQSRTTAKGGISTVPELDPWTGRRQPLARSRTSEMNMKTLRIKDLEDIDGDHLDTALEAMQLMKPKQRRIMEAEARAAAASVAPKYIDKDVAAYAANRLPSTYSAVFRVLSELQGVAPGFQPERMLDYGAGPGTAAWAAHEVWGDSLKEVVAVEPSESMMSLGEGLYDARRANAENEGKDSPKVKWLYKIPGFNPRFSSPSKTRRPKGMQRHNMVVASYVLTELDGPKERLALAKGLWDMTDDILVIIEPGTPVGSANCREIRAMLLGIGKDSETTQGKADEDAAHVLMPCTHDGRCPLDGTKNWCHFVQRHTRTRAQRHVKATANRSRPRGYQDEKFSYVVLRRGPRPGSKADLSLLHPLWSKTKGAPRGKAAAEKREEAWESLDEDARQLILEAIQAGDDEEDRGLADHLQGTDDTQADNSSREAPRDASSSGSAAAAVQSSAAMDVASDDLFRAGTEDDDEDEPLDVLDADDLDGEAVRPEAVQAVMAHSSAWGRIIRVPKKRRRHVVMQVCSPGHRGNPEAMSSDDSAVLEELTISKSFDKRFRAPGPYYSARRAQWGDAWPLLYRK